jgi:hypothetical protein
LSISAHYLDGIFSSKARQELMMCLVDRHAEHPQDNVLDDIARSGEQLPRGV